MNFLRIKALIFFLILFFLFFLYQNEYLGFLNSESLEILLNENSKTAGFIFAFVYAITTVLFIPVGPFVVLAGAIFGAVYRMFYVLIGAVLRGIISLIISRFLFREYFEKLCAKKLPRFKRYSEALERNEKEALFLLRLTPIIPSNILNYTCGLTRVSLITFIWTFVGVIPGTLFYTYLGTSLMDLNTQNTLVLAFLAILMITLTYSVRRHLPQKT